MPTELDSLQIEITAKAQSANTAIDNLATKLDRLTTSMASLNRTNLSGFSMSMRNIATSMQGLKDVKLPDYTRLAKGINKFASIDTANIYNAGTAMQELGKSLRILDGVNLSDDAIKVADFVKSVSKFGNKSATQAVDNIPRLATALRNLMGTLSGAPLVSQNLIDMTNALANLSRTGSSSGRASTSLARSFDLYSSSSNRARKSTWSLARAFGKMYASYWLVFRAFRQIGKAIDISSQLTEIQNVVDVTFGDMTYKVEQFAETSIEKFGMSELTLKKTASQFQAMGSAMNINSKNIASANKYLNSQTDKYVDLGNSMADVSVTLTKLTADMSSFYNVEQKVIAEDLQSIFTGQTKPLRQYGIDLTEVNLKQWAMNEGLNSNIESMTQAEKVMLRYQYVLAHTTQAQGDFARTANTWANQIRILKQNFEQLGVIIGQTFINMLKPLVRMLNTVMSSILAFAETVSNALGKIFGWKFEVGAGGITNELEDGAGYADDLSDAMGSSADEAKRLRTYLLGIDELNVIDPQDVASGGSGGAGGAGGGGASGGQWVKGETIFEDYKSEIDSLFELGDYISQTLSRAMESIDWEKIYEKARGFGTGLADFLNGLISPRLFGNIGKTIANSLNTALYFLNSFGETFDFYEFGESIAWGIRDFFDNFDFTLLAETLNTWVDGIKLTIKGFVDTITWDSILEGGKDFLGNLELDTIEIIIGGFALKHAGKVLTSLSLRNIINNKFNTLITGAFGTGAKALGAKGATGFAITATVLVAFQFAKDIAEWKQNIEELGWDEGRKATASGNSANPYLDDSAYNQKLNDMTLKWQEFKAKISDENLANPYIDTSEYNKQMDEMNEKWTTWKTNISESLENSKESFNQWFVDFGTGFGTWYDENVKPFFSVETWESLWGNIKTSAETKWNELVEWWNGTALVTWWEEDVKPWFDADTWKELYSTIQTELEATWDSVVKWWTTSGIYRWYNDNVKPWFSKENWTFSGIKDGLVSAWESAIAGVKAVWNKFANWFNSKMTIELPKIEIAGETVFDGKTIKFIQLPTFATGGFPEDGLFMANHGELVGKFSNGRTVVANNQQIIDGIALGVSQANTEEVVLLGQAVGILTELVGAVREGKSITIDGRELVEAYDNRKTRNGYAF